MRLKTMLAFAVVLLLPATAGARELHWEGTLILPFSTQAKFTGTGTALATLDAKGGLGRLQIADGINGIATVQITDPGLSTVSLQVVAGVNNITITDDQPKKIAVTGWAKWCYLWPECMVMGFGYISLPFSGSTPSQGVGLGGTITGGGPSPSTSVTLRLEAAPFIVKKARGPYGFGATTANIVKTTGGDVIGGHLQLVTPMVVNGTNIPETMNGFAGLIINFVPEPAFDVLLAAGILGLLAIGRGRYRR